MINHSQQDKSDFLFVKACTVVSNCMGSAWIGSLDKPLYEEAQRLYEEAQLLDHFYQLTGVRIAEKGLVYNFVAKSCERAIVTQFFS